MKSIPPILLISLFALNCLADHDGEALRLSVADHARTSHDVLWQWETSGDSMTAYNSEGGFDPHLCIVGDATGDGIINFNDFLLAEAQPGEAGSEFGFQPADSSRSASAPDFPILAEYAGEPVSLTSAPIPPMRFIACLLMFGGGLLATICSAF